MYMASSQFKVLVGVQLDKKSLSALQGQIDGKKINIKANFDSKGILSELKAINATIKSLGKISGLDSVSADLTQTSSKATKANSDFSRLLATIRQIGGLRAKIMGLDASSEQASILLNRLMQLEREASELKNTLNGNMSGAQFERLSKTMSDASVKADLFNAKIKDIVNVNMSNGTFHAQMSKIEASLNRIQSQSPQTVSAVNALRDAFAKLQAAQKTNDASVMANAHNNFTAALRAANNQIQMNISSEKKLIASERQLANASRQTASAMRLMNSKESLISSIDLWLKNNSMATKQFGAQLSELKMKLMSCDATELNNLRHEFSEIKKAAQMAGVASLNFTDRLKAQMRRYSSYFSIASGFMYGTMAIRNMARAILEVDTAMTGLYRVTEMTSSKMEGFYDNMIASAKEYGRTLTDTINATTDWVRAGFDAETALGLAEKTAMYQNVSDLDYDEASENLLTSFNGFKESLMNAYGGSEVEAVGHIVDVLNELDNNFSVTSAGLGEGLSRSASALQIAGNTFEESAA